MRRTCANCHASEWPRLRWCRDCWRMVGKTVVFSAASALGAALAKGFVTWAVNHL